MLFEKLHNAREVFEKAQTLSSGLAISMQKMTVRAAGIDEEITRFENYCASKGIPLGEDIALLSLRTRRTNLVRSLETLRTRSAEVDSVLSTKREEIQQLESFLSKELANEIPENPTSPSEETL